MAIRDPNDRFRINIPTLPNDNARPYAATSARFELKLHEIAPEDIEPLGDRYVAEVIDVDEKVDLGWMLVVTPPPKDDAGNPMADPTVEKRGVIAAVICAVGNGHLLGLSDHPWSDSKDEDERDWASVPMFYSVGDVVLVDYNARGRALKIVGRECRILNQIDCLAKLPVRLRRVDGAWVPAE